MEKYTKIQKSVLQTMAFYDVFDFPLNRAEIIDNLWKTKAKASQIDAQITQLLDQNIIFQQDCFFFLKGREELVDIRKERYLSSFHKMMQIRREKWIFRLAPFVKMIGLANTLAYSNAKEDGDIDVLVVATEGRLYTARIFLTFWLLIFNRWRHGSLVKNRYCRSFLVTEKAMDMSRLKFHDSDDIYLCYWTKWLKPWFVNDVHVADKFFQDNEWVQSYIPNHIYLNYNQEPEVKSYFAIFFEMLLHGGLGDLLENILHKMMLSKIKIKTKQFDIDGTIADHDMLKFHPSGKRKKYEQEWQDKTKELSV